MFGKPFHEEAGGLMRDVQQDVIGAALLHFTVNGAGDDVARGQRLERVVPVHELDPRQRLEHAALAAHRFTDEKRLGPRVIEAGGMELDEFHVRHAGSGAIGHGHPVAGGDVGVGRIEIDLAATTGGQHRDSSGEGLNQARGFVEAIDPEAAVDAGPAEFLARDQIDRQMVFRADRWDRSSCSGSGLPLSYASPAGSHKLCDYGRVCTDIFWGVR